MLLEIVLRCGGGHRDILLLFKKPAFKVVISKPGFLLVYRRNYLKREEQSHLNHLMCSYTQFSMEITPVNFFLTSE